MRDIIKRVVTSLMSIMEKKNELIDRQANEIQELRRQISSLEKKID
jgi:polyhydroxyalkanoate synthesis regulator phasin